MDQIMWYMLLGSIVLIVALVTMEMVVRSTYLGAKEPCTSHKWFYDDIGDLTCSLCNRRAMDILNE